MHVVAQPGSNFPVIFFSGMLPPVGMLRALCAWAHGCRAFGAGSVRIYGGSRGFAESGCELAEHGEAFASSISNGWLHFVYNTAEEAFSTEEVRVQLHLFHEFPMRRTFETTNPGRNSVRPCDRVCWKHVS